MLDRKPLLVTVVALAALAWIGGSPPAHAGGKNQIKGVAIRDDAGATTIRIQGSGTPTFTVYKLERPTRVVVDVAAATLDRSVRGDEPSATFAVGSWSVSQVAAMAMEDGSTSVRVVITLARPGRYDVKAEGKDVVVKVMARDPAPASVTSADLATARADADRARAEVTRVQSEAAAARGQVDDLRSAAATAKKEAETARADARTAQRTAEQEQQRARDAIAAAEAARKAADEAGRVASSASASDRATAEKRVADAKAEAARARTTADRASAAARAATQKAEADARAAQVAAADEIAKAKAAAAAEVAKARAAATAANQDAERRIAAAEAGAATATDRARADAARDRAAAAQARADAERERAAATAAKAEADRAIADAKTKLTKVEADRKRVEADARLAAQARDEARTAQAQAEARERAARDSEQKAAAERRAAQDAVKQAELERSKAAGASTDAVRARAAADEKIKDAEARLARADAARVSAETARKNAERSAALARKDAERAAAAARTDAAAAQAAVTAAAAARAQADAATREAMSQRAAAESQRAAAEQRRADTVAAAERAETRRAQAEVEASAATERRTVEEAAAAQAAAARKAEEAATARARRARETEEQAARAATTGRADAEARKQAAERAADEVERALASERDAAKVARDRRRAAEDAEAEASAAARRKASADEIAAARAEAARLTAERERAERELAAKSKDVTRTRTESERLAAERSAATAELTRLKQAAAEARDARAREEARLVDVTKALAAAEAASAAKATAGPRAGADAGPRASDKAGPRASGLGPRSEETPPAKPVVAKPVVAKPVKAGARVAAVRFAPTDTEHTVVVDLEGAGASAELVRTGTRKAELHLHGATLPADLARTLDTSRFGGPIRAVSSYTDPASGDVRVVVDLTADVTPRLDTSGGDVRLAFATGGKVRTQSVPGPVVGGFGATSTPVTQTSVAQLGRRKVYRGPTIELDFKDADIHDLLRTLADVGRVNIVVPDEIRANVTVRMKRVPWDQALEVILASKGLWYRKEGNLYRVAPRKQLDAEDEAEAARLKAMVELEAPKPEVYTLNYTDAASVKPTLEPLLSPKGKIEVDKRTNSIIVNDVRANRREIIDLASRLDTQTPQISIEARIVEARSQYERQIGIQWGGRALAGAAGGSATGLIFPSTIGLTGGAGSQDTNSQGVAAPADFAVNLPANGSNGAIGMTLGSVGGNVNINLRLSALEESGTIRIISAPKVTVLNNVEAEMKQGVKIPISIVSAQGTQTQFVNALLALKVTPYVSQRDCAIMMDINVTKDEPDFVNTGARGDPTILNKEAKTRMLVNDGETSVMGGIYTRNTGLSYSKVPYFADIPVLGWLFKNRRETDDRAELLIFITPKITNKASLRCTP